MPRLATERLCPAHPSLTSLTVGREPRTLGAVPDAQHRNRVPIRYPEVYQIPVGTRDGAPDIILPNQRIGERVQGDAFNRGPDVCPDVECRSDVQRAIVKADSRQIRDGFRVIIDLHGPKRAKAASTSSSLAKIPARDRARALSSAARSSSLSVSQIEGSATGAPSATSFSSADRSVVVRVRGEVMPSRIALQSCYGQS